MNYKEETLSTTKWRRCHEVHIYNPTEGKRTIRFDEQDVVSAPDGAIAKYMGMITADYNAAESFPLLNPSTGAATGATMTHEQLYTALYSLYMKTATTRDAQQS